MTLAWPIKIGERVSIEPSIAAFNVFNMANFIIPTFLTSAISSSLIDAGPVGAAGSVTGTSPGANRASLRVGTGSGSSRTELHASWNLASG